LVIAGFVRNPWKGGNQAALWITGWKPLNGETVYLRADTGVLARSFGSDPTT
jgi:ubiquinol-cytochrome c reductase iron-sulfur subunit